MKTIQSGYQELLRQKEKWQADRLSWEQLHGQQAAEISYLKEELAQLKRLIFGQKRERYVSDGNDDQLQLGFDNLEEKSSEIIEEKITYQRKRSAKTKQIPNRLPFPAHLLRKDIMIEPDEDLAGMKKIGEEITEELEYKESELYVNRYIRPRYAKENEQGISIGKLPSRLIEKGGYGPALVTHFLISKFIDHIPFYRQRQQFKRQGVNLPESTINDAMRKSCELLFPLYERLTEDVLCGPYLMVDETPIKVLDRTLKGKTHRGYYWVYLNVLNKQVFFDYQESRSSIGPTQRLKNFKGFLQSDDYCVYDQFDDWPQIVSLRCMAHARRKFEQAQDSDRERAQWMLDEIRKLYRIERKAKEDNLSFQERYQLRCELASPIMKNIKNFLDKNIATALPQSLIGKAIRYMLKQWPKLNNYLIDGCLEIDNNWVENAIRPVALGRKNYLFAGSHAGARRAALIYSLVSTAKLQQVEPQRYIKDVLTRIADYPYKQVADLLPANWKISDTAEK